MNRETLALMFLWFLGFFFIGGILTLIHEFKWLGIWPFRKGHK